MPAIMGEGDIAFPHLGIYLNNVPKGFSVFGFFIALYGVIIATGMVLAVVLDAKLAPKNDVKPDHVWDMALYVIFFGVLGARAYYVIFAWDHYKDNLVSILNIRNGGLGIYGGVLAGILTLYIYCKRHKLTFFQTADTILPGVTLGQLMGRWGNFTNREAFGQYTDSLFAMRLPIAAVRANDISDSIRAGIVEGTNYIQVHPTFLYESMWNICLLILMIWATGHKKFKGQIFSIYMAGYGIGRFWIEGLRTDQLLVPGTGLAISQVVAIVMILCAIMMNLVGYGVIKVGKKEAAEPQAEVVIEKKAVSEENGEDSAE